MEPGCSHTPLAGQGHGFFGPTSPRIVTSGVARSMEMASSVWATATLPAVSRTVRRRKTFGGAFAGTFQENVPVLAICGGPMFSHGPAGFSAHWMVIGVAVR